MHVLTTNRRRTVSAAVALAAMTLISACGDRGADGSATAATVGEEKVTRTAVMGAVDRALAGETKETKPTLISNHLSTQVKLALYRVEAAKLGVTLTEEERKLTRTALEEQTAGSGGLDKAAETSGIAKQDIGDIVDLVTFEKLLGQQLVKGAPVTDAELEKLRETTPNLPKFEDQVSAAHILVKDEALAKKLLAELKAGGDFAALAGKNSLDPGSKDKGGDLGAQPKGTFVPEFEAALATAKPGEVVGPVKTQFGFHLIKSTVVPGAEIKEQTRVQATPLVARNRLHDLISKGPEVKINSRFGTWDAEKLRVIGPEGVNDQDNPSAPSGAPGNPEGVPGGSSDQPGGSAPAPAPSQ